MSVDLAVGRDDWKSIKRAGGNELLLRRRRIIRGEEYPIIKVQNPVIRLSCDSRLILGGRVLRHFSGIFTLRHHSKHLLGMIDLVGEGRLLQTS